MIIYLVLAVMPVFLVLFFGNLDNPKAKRGYLIVCGLLLFLFMGFRSYSVGSNDTRNYMDMMRTAIKARSWKQLYDPDGVESGFQMLLFLLSRVFDNEQSIVIVSSALFTALTLWFIFRNSQDIPLSVTLYITLGLMMFHMQGMRQSIAMCLCFIAYEFAKKRKLVLFAIVIAFASLFHQTAIVFAIVYFIPRIKFNVINLLLAFIAAIAMFALSGQIVNLANKLFGMEYVTEVDSGGFIATIIYGMVLAFAFLFNKRLRKGTADRQDAALFYITFLGFALYVMRYFSAQQVERISFYFVFGQMILLPNTAQQLNTRERVITKTAIYALSILLFLYRIKGSNFDPYAFCW